MADEMKDARTAIQNGDLTKLKNLVEKNPGILKEISSFGSVLQIAAREGNKEIVSYLLDCKCDVNFGGGLFKKSPIGEAAFKGKLEIVDLLIRNGAKLDVSSFENNPLFAAIYNKHVDVAKYLIDKGIDINAKYSLGEFGQCDACEYAKQYGVEEIYEYLKSKK
ncbi:MAG: ankyrin repeat domain-containing protein [Treponema sp.]|nr:ankyrin repeat domain-containing protein [Treponema sp.]